MKSISLLVAGLFAGSIAFGQNALQQANPNATQTQGQGQKAVKGDNTNANPSQGEHCITPIKGEKQKSSQVNNQAQQPVKVANPKSMQTPGENHGEKVST